MATFVGTAPFLRQSNRLLGCPVSAVKVKILCEKSYVTLNKSRKKGKKKIINCNVLRYVVPGQTLSSHSFSSFMFLLSADV